MRMIMQWLSWVQRNSVYLLLMTLIGKLILFRLTILGDASFVGMLSDMGAVGFIIALPGCFVVGAWRRWLQMLAALLISTIWFSSAVYYSYYGNVPTYYALSNLNQIGQIGESISATIELDMLLYLVDFIVIGCCILFAGGKRTNAGQLGHEGGNKQKRFWRARAIPTIVTFVSAGIIAGSLQGAKEIENNHALAKRLGVISYQLAISDSMDKGYYQEITNEERSDLREQVRHWLASQNKEELHGFNGIAAGHNLIVVQVEAMQNFVIDLEINDQEITPYLNQLVKRSFYFPNVYQQIGEGNTSDAEYIMNTGAYPSAVQATSTMLTGREAPSLPHLLAQQGYQSFTFHVNDVTFWNRNEMYPALGFTEYFDRPSFENDQFNSYGASDEQLYKVALDKLQQLQEQDQRFYAQLVTVSSHHPYKIPQQYQLLELPDELVDTQLGHYLQAMHYTDQQLGKFMRQLDDKALLRNSVVAIYGDHFGLQQKDNDPSWVSEQLGISYHDTISRMNVPFIVAVPGVAGERVDQVGGQLDMLPTILNLLGISETNSPLILFGSDLLNADHNIIGVRYYLPSGSFMNDELLFIPGTGFSDGRAFSLTTHEELEVDDSLKDDYLYILELMSFSDLYTSSYPKRNEN